MGGSEPLTATDRVLEHHGVKGMKWGVIKSTSSSKGASRTSVRKGTTSGVKGHAEAHEFLATDKHPKNPFHPVHPHDREVHSGETSTRTQFADFRTTKVKSPSGGHLYYRKFGTGEKAIDLSPTGGTWSHFIDANGAPHQDINKLRAYSSVKHVMDFGDVLEHHGVKGMKWGVRKRDSGGSTSMATVRKRKKDGGVEVNRTWYGRKIHDSKDGAKEKADLKEIKKHSTTALSNEDLQNLVNRIKLDQEYARLTYNPGMKEKAQQLIKDVAFDVTEKQAKRVANHIVGGKLDQIFDMAKASKLPKEGAKEGVKLLVKKPEKSKEEDVPKISTPTPPYAGKHQWTRTPYSQIQPDHAKGPQHGKESETQRLLNKYRYDRETKRMSRASRSKK